MRAYERTRLGRGETGREPAYRENNNRITTPLEKLRRSDWYYCLYLQRKLKDQPWLGRESGGTSCAARNSHAHITIVPSVNSARISTYTEATQTVPTW